jgi:hypothetical protein
MSNTDTEHSNNGQHNTTHTDAMRETGRSRMNTRLVRVPCASIHRAHKHFEVEANLTRWSAMDYYSSAILPYIGYLYRGSNTIYTATGFSKWGLANGVASGLILRDMMTGVKNPWADMVDARRWDLMKQASGAAMEGWHTTKHFISDKIKVTHGCNNSTGLMTDDNAPTAS